MKNVVRIALKVLLPLLAIAAGIGIFTMLVRTKPQPSRSQREQSATLVEVQRAEAGNHQVVVSYHGEVVPSKRIVLQPDVGGRVVWQSPELVPGGRFAEGDRIVRIDPRDYQVALEQQQSAVEQARTQLEQERGRQTVAEREWELFGEEGESSEQGRALALREPQVRAARVAVDAAESGMRRARLTLSRTTLAAPFDAIVTSESVDPGQLVGPQYQLATLVGSDAFWVRVSVPMEMLRWIDVPGMRGAEEGSPARVRQEAGENVIEREGRVVRLLGDLDPVGRMARILVEIDDPYALEDEDSLPMLLGSFVDVEILGDVVEDVYEVPRTALREGERVWLVDADDQLELRDVEIAWRTEDSVWVRTGLEDGDRLVTSRIPTPVEGMRLRLDDGEDAPTEQRAEAP